MASEHGELTTVTFNSVEIPQITSIDGPSISQSGIETNYMGCGTITQRASDKTELGTVSVSMVYSSDEAGHVALPAALLAGTEATLAVAYSDADGVNETWSANAFVSNFELSAEDDADVTAECEFQLMEDPTIS